MSAANPSVQINFSGSGVKQFTITVQYTNASTFTHTSEVQIGSNTEPYSNRLEGLSGELPDAIFWISSKYPYQGYEENQPYYGKAKISIWWKRNAQNQPVPGIKKPVIIVDGFDPLGERLDTGIYKLFKYINQNNNPDNFADELRSNGKDFDIIVMDLPGYKQNAPGTINDLSSSLPYPKALYDDVLPADLKGVIFGGGDYVQRNAYTLEALIDYCNQQMLINGSNEKQVVVGPSMGGQITRYALRDMELRGQNHNCRLWVSFDSNHEGAYAPVGIQYSLNELAPGSEEGKRLRDTYINSPIAKQTLIHHYLAFSETVKGAPGFYDRYYNEINNPSFGFPQAAGLRKIAMISGSDLGVPQTFGTACQLATKLEVQYKPRGILPVLISILTTPGALGYSLSPLQTQKTYLAPATGQCTIFKYSDDFAPDYSRKIFAPSYSNTSFDMLQGGFFPAFNVYKSQIDGKRPKKWYKNFVKVVVDDYVGNQVQQLTYSTMAIGLGSLPDPTRKWDDNFRKDKNNQPVDVTCPETKESPFDMYWAPDINTRHDSLLLGHVVRLRKEIIDKQPWPKTQIQRSATITGNKTLLCPGETASFSISNPLTGMVYNWVPFSNFLQVIAGQGTSTVTIQHNGSSTIQGIYSISCNASSQCYNITAPDYQFYVGKPLIKGYYNSPTNSSQPLNPWIRFTSVSNEVCYGEYITTNMEVWPGTTVTWEASGDSGGLSWWQTGNNLRFYFTDINQWASFTVTTTNACGSTSVRYRFNSVDGNCGGIPLKLVISPNPSNGITQAFLYEKRDKGKKKNIFTIRIIDKMGILKRQFYFEKGTSTAFFDISELHLDVYTIMAFDGKVWTATKFIKK